MFKQLVKHIIAMTFDMAAAIMMLLNIGRISYPWINLLFLLLAILFAFLSGLQSRLVKEHAEAFDRSYDILTKYSMAIGDLANLTYSQVKKMCGADVVSDNKEKSLTDKQTEI